MKNDKGFTLIEILIAVTLLSVATALLLGTVNYQDRAARNTADKITTDFGAIEAAFNNFYADKSGYPTGLGDVTFVPLYLFVPKAPSTYDGTYGTNGYNLGLRTGQASPNNGYYLCAKASVTGAADTNWLATTYIGQRLSPNKYFVNTSCPATTNMAAPGGAATIYLTIWLTRY